MGRKQKQPLYFFIQNPPYVGVEGETTGGLALDGGGGVGGGGEGDTTAGGGGDWLSPIKHTIMPKRESWYVVQPCW